MIRAVPLLIVILFSGATACVSSGHSPIGGEASAAARRPISPDHSWTPIALNDIADPGIRLAVTDLLLLIDSDFLWPDFALDDHPVIVVDSRDAQHAATYCVGHCAPRVQGGGGISRVWRGTGTAAVATGQARFASLDEWGLRGSGEVVAVGFNRREQTVTVTVHEDFHLHYQTEYTLAFGDEIRGDGESASDATRTDLEHSYSRSGEIAAELREECTALVEALHAGVTNRPAALAALRRFSAVRSVRRARPGAPSFEEDFWEHQEGIPANLERRMAMRMKFADPSVIGTALTGNGCDAIPRAAYFLVLGGLQSAVLDELGDPLAWPRRVYPRDGTPALSLYLLVRGLSTESETR